MQFWIPVQLTGFSFPDEPDFSPPAYGLLDTVRTIPPSIFCFCAYDHDGLFCKRPGYKNITNLRAWFTSKIQASRGREFKKGVNKHTPKEQGGMWKVSLVTGLVACLTWRVSSARWVNAANGWGTLPGSWLAVSASLAFSSLAVARGGPVYASTRTLIASERWSVLVKAACDEGKERS